MLLAIIVLVPEFQTHLQPLSILKYAVHLDLLLLQSVFLRPLAGWTDFFLAYFVSGFVSFKVIFIFIYLGQIFLISVFSSSLAEVSLDSGMQS
jgi:hypothetical protein